MTRRRVKHLKLAAPSRDAAAGQLPVLEDAFGTASLPGIPPNAHVAVRRLDLGTLKDGVSSAELAFAIGEQMRLLAAGAVCIDSQDAPAASVVYFSDTAHMHARILARAAAREPLRAWYWPALTVDSADGVTLPLNGAPPALARWSLAALTAQPAHAAVLARVLTALVTSGRVDAVLRLVDIAIGAQLARQVVRPAAIRDRHVLALAREAQTPAWRVTLEKWIGFWGPDDPRSVWLALQPVLVARPELDASAIAASVARAIVARSAAVRGLPARIVDAREDTAWVSQRNAPSTAQDVTVTRARAAHASGAAGPLPRERDNVPTHEEFTSAEPRDVDDLPLGALRFNSAHAGLAFLIPILARLGMHTLLDAHPALLLAGLPQRVLNAYANLLGVPREDPLRQLMSAGDRCEPSWLKRFRAPPAWLMLTVPPGASVRLVPQAVEGTEQAVLCGARGVPLLAGPREEVQSVARKTFAGAVWETWGSRTADLSIAEVVDGYARVVARHLRRAARIGVRDLVVRKAEILITLTHVDVRFPAASADVRVRRAALDVDPGWVSWLGRVVQYHYVTSDELDRFESRAESAR